MKRIYQISFLLFFISSSCNAQNETKSSAGEIKWMTFEQAVARNESAPKKIFIDISTDWCGYCKKMDASTFKDSSVIKFINEHFYAVRINAETHDTIHFQDKQFVYKPEYKANEIALSLLSGQMSYPTFVFMDEKYALLSPLSGYQTVPQMMPALKFFGTDIYKTIKWEDYQKSSGN